MPNDCSSDNVVRIPLFNTDEHEAVFWATLERVHETGLLPDVFNLQPDDHPERAYPVRELVRMGRRRVEVAVELPSCVWLPRSIQWCQALDLLLRLGHVV